MDKIDGYEIQKTILFETGYGFALGCVPGMPEKSAVWNFTQTACGRDYYHKSCHAAVMIHDPLTTGISGSALSVEQASRRLMETREITASILADHTGHTIEEVYEKTRQDSYFNAEEAVAWRLADRIITGI